MDKAIYFRASQHVQDFLPMSKRNVIDFEGPAQAWQKAFEEANISLQDLGFAEVHDCFTSAELLTYEAMGLTGRGKGEIAIKEGWTAPEGKLPINRSGGLKSKGHPLGATGISQTIEIVNQLQEKCDKRQISNAKIGLIQNMSAAGTSSSIMVLQN